MGQSGGSSATKARIVSKVTLVAMEGSGRLELNETDYPIYEDGTVIGRIGDIKIREMI